jgi:hypothetical protein
MPLAWMSGRVQRERSQLSNDGQSMESTTRETAPRPSHAEFFKRCDCCRKPIPSDQRLCNFCDSDLCHRTVSKKIGDWTYHQLEFLPGHGVLLDEWTEGRGQ